MGYLSSKCWDYPLCTRNVGNIHLLLSIKNIFVKQWNTGRGKWQHNTATEEEEILSKELTVTAICNYQGKTYNSPLMNWLQIAINSSERRFGTCHNNALPVCGHSVLQVASGLLLVWSSDPAASMCFYLATFIFRTGKKLASCCSKF